jgi:hypothetical protein
VQPHRSARVAEPHRRPALPDWQASDWLNTSAPPTQASLRGRVVLLHTFQMLCPGCVLHGLPQAERVWRAFPRDRLAVVGLHTVFEHHAAMTPAALRAFVHEYGWSFPIGVDTPGSGTALPRTMALYGLQGTPTHLLLDAQGRVALHHFGALDDLAMGAAIGSLLAESNAREPVVQGAPRARVAEPDARPACDTGACEARDGAALPVRDRA